MAGSSRNLAASVRDRLKHAARQRGEVFQYVLTLYGLERLLYRLYQSPHADAFVLKGALLFQLWMDEPHRATRDMDLLGHGPPSADLLEQIFNEVCTADVEPDGLTFLGESVRPVAGDGLGGIRRSNDGLNRVRHWARFQFAGDVEQCRDRRGSVCRRLPASPPAAFPIGPQQFIRRTRIRKLLVGIGIARQVSG